MLTTPDKALAKINKIMFATPATALGDEKKNSQIQSECRRLKL